MKPIFCTPFGSEVPTVTKAEMIEIDRLAIEQYGPNLFQMMENAGRSLAVTIIRAVSKIRNPKILILAGTGGNGGGGICAARHLQNRSFDVSLAVTDVAKLSEVPKEQLEIFFNSGGKIANDLEELHADLIVDAIIGYSLTDAPRGKANEFIEWAKSQNAVKVALDIPSGLDATTGEIFGNYFNPDVTLTLALPKSGLLDKNCGEIFLADLGIPKVVFEKIGIKYTSPFQNDFIVKLGIV